MSAKCVYPTVKYGDQVTLVLLNQSDLGSGSSSIVQYASCGQESRLMITPFNSKDQSRIVVWQILPGEGNTKSQGDVVDYNDQIKLKQVSGGQTCVTGGFLAARAPSSSPSGMVGPPVPVVDGPTTSPDNTGALYASTQLGILAQNNGPIPLIRTGEIRYDDPLFISYGFMGQHFWLGMNNNQPGLSLLSSEATGWTFRSGTPPYGPPAPVSCPTVCYASGSTCHDRSPELCQSAEPSGANICSATGQLARCSIGEDGTPTYTCPEAKKGLSTGTLILIILGVLVGLVLLGYLIYLLTRKKK